MNHIEKPRLTVSCQTLLAIYLFVPISVMIVLFDHYGWHDTIKRSLPANPEHLRLYLIFLVVPHIIASTAGFFDRDYVKFYKTKLLQAAVVAVSLGLVMPRLVAANTAFTIFLIYSLFHNMTQQVGVSMFMFGKPTPAFKSWKWLTILTAIVSYYLIFKIPPRPIPQWVNGHDLRVIVLLLLIAMIGSTYVVSLRARSRMGMAYLWANCAMLTVQTVYYQIGYACVAIALLRVTHDLTGFVFYVVHDQNRNADEIKNGFYRLFRFFGAPIYILSPILAVLIANAFVELRVYPFVSQGLLTLSYFHYYAEGFMWKRGTPHRDNVPVADAGSQPTVFGRLQYARD